MENKQTEYTLNKRLLKVTGKVEIEDELMPEQDVSVTLNVIDTTRKYNGDGTYDLIYNAKLLAPTPVSPPISTLPSKNSRSQYHRYLLEQLYLEKNLQEKYTWKEFYNKYYDKKDAEILEKINK